MRKYRFAIVGCGMISNFHVAALSEIENAELVAMSDIVPEAAERAKEEHGVDTYTAHRKMFERDDIDVVNICTPSGVHLDPAIDAANAGKHVIVEKPLEITLKRCDKIIEACENADVKLCTIFPSRFSECNKLLKKVLEDGRFGTLALGDAYIKWYRTQEYYDSGGWRGTWKLDGGGALMNQSIHAIDLLQWFMGPVKSIQSFCETLAHERIEVEDTAVATLRFENGALGVIEGTTAAYPGLLKKIEISGNKGTVIIEEEDIIRWEFEDELPEDEEIRKKFASKKSGGGGAADPSAISHENHKRQILDMLDAIENDKKPLVDGYEGRKAVEIILGIYKSSQEGKIVNLPL